MSSYKGKKIQTIYFAILGKNSQPLISWLILKTQITLGKALEESQKRTVLWESWIENNLWVLSCLAQPQVWAHALGRDRMLWRSCMSFPTDGYFESVEADCRSFASHLLGSRKPPSWRKVFSMICLCFGDTKAHRFYRYLSMLLFPVRTLCCHRMSCVFSFRMGSPLWTGESWQGILFLSCNGKMTEHQLVSSAWLAKDIWRLPLGLEYQAKTWFHLYWWINIKNAHWISCGDKLSRAWVIVANFLFCCDNYLFFSLRECRVTVYILKSCVAFVVWLKQYK